MLHGDSRSPEAQRRSIEDTSPRSSRKVSTYGGSRAWSEEEEAYLLEARQCKTPYKHIAAHLQKTELACRLHFHQLAYGTKRKRRSPSTSSAATTQESRNPSVQATDRGHASQRSIDSTNSHASTETTQQTKLTAPIVRVPTFSPPTSPPPAQRRRLARSESPPHHDDCLHVPAISTQAATSTIPASSTFSPFPAQSPFPTLPHLNPAHGSHPLHSPSAFSYTSAPSYGLPPSLSQSQTPYPNLPEINSQDLSAPRPRPHSYSPSQVASDPRSSSNHRHSHLIDTASSNSAPPSLSATSIRPHSPNNIDPYRLSGIYSRKKHAFWINIAREYGGNVSPSALEAAFLRQSAGSPTGSLPTPPNRSPVLGLPNTAKPVEDHAEQGQRARSDSGERRGSRESDGRDGGTGCSIASLLTDDKDVWQRRRTA